MVVAHAIAQVDGDRRGIHVLFAGPPAWLYAPEGWVVERRLWQRPDGRTVCADLRDALLAELHREREVDTPIGLATLRNGTWVHPASGTPGTAEVLTVDLAEPTSLATVAMPGPNWTAYGVRAGKVVAAAPAQTAAGQVILSAPGIDRIVVHAQHANSWRVCTIGDPAVGMGWTEIARLQLPLREVNASLTGPDDEWELARRRLIPGDDLDQATFAELADALRPLPVEGSERPIDRSIRPDPESPDTILGALDPLRLAVLDPQVRRVLGFAHFDDDPALQLGQTYQYRVSTKYPPDAAAARPGFQTVPVGTQVPASFFLGDVHVRLARPSLVELLPTGAAGEIVVGRRAISIGPRENPHWLLPDLLDAAAVLDFAAPRSQIVLELADADLHYEAFDADGGAAGSGDLSSGEPTLTFSAPAARVVLHGKARWLGLREPTAASSDLFWDTTGPVVLAEPPPPPVPLSITAAVAGLSTPKHERATAAQRARLRRDLAARARTRRQRVAAGRRRRSAVRGDALRARARAARRRLRTGVRRERPGVRRPRRQAARPARGGRRRDARLPRAAPAARRALRRTSRSATTSSATRNGRRRSPAPSTVTAFARSTRSAARAHG